MVVTGPQGDKLITVNAANVTCITTEHWEDGSWVLFDEIAMGPFAGYIADSLYMQIAASLGHALGTGSLMVDEDTIGSANQPEYEEFLIMFAPEDENE